MHGPGRRVPLDFGAELWNSDLSLFESVPGIAAVLERSHPAPGDDRIWYEATRSLLADVVDAAGGAELALGRLHASMDLAQERYDPSLVEHVDESVEVGLSDPSTEDAWYAMAELWMWARTLDDRLKRKAVTTGQKKPQGLIPALADGPRREAVVRARSKMLMSPVGEAQHLANLHLHMQPVPAGTKSARVRAGKVILPFPDKVTSTVSHRSELTYKDRRDGVTFADDLSSAMELFMDAMLTAFETHLPERFRSPP
jgi:hypothetical protein